MADKVHVCMVCGEINNYSVGTPTICLVCNKKKFIPTDMDDLEYWKLRPDERAGWEEQARERYVYHNKYFVREKYESMLARKSQFLNMVKNNTFPEKAKCISCGSTNLEKISAGNKVASAVAFGVFAVGHVNKTFRCLNCGMKF